MDRKKFQRDFHYLIFYMNDVGYSKGYVQSIKKVGTWIIGTGIDCIDLQGELLKEKLKVAYPQAITLTHIATYPLSSSL